MQLNGSLQILLLSLLLVLWFHYNIINIRGIGMGQRPHASALYEAEAWGKRSAERREVNVLEMKC